MTSALILGMGQFEEQRGGLNRYVAELAAALDLPIPPVTVSPQASLLRRLLSSARAARAAAGSVDVVDAHFALYAWWPTVAGALRRHPLVVHVHGSWAGEAAPERRLAARAKELIERAVYSRATRVLVLSEAVRDLVVQRYCVDPARVTVCPPGVDTVRFCPGPPARQALRLPPSSPVVLAVRRLVPRTGVDVLVQAMERLPGTHLAVVGDGPCRRALQEQARRIGVADRVTFAGVVDDEELPLWYRSADVSVVPSLSDEGWGLVVDESLACGTPVLASRIGGLSSSLARLPADCLVAPKDPAALADRLRSGLDRSVPLPGPAACRTATAGRDWAAVAATTRALHEAVRRPRVVVVGHCARPSGAELALLQLAPELAELVELTVVLGEDGLVAQGLREAGVCLDVLALPAAAAGADRARSSVAAATSAAVHVPRLAALLRRRRATVVHAWTLRSGFYAAPAARLAGAAFVWSARDRLTPDYLPPRVAQAARHVADRRGHVVVGNSASTLTTWRLSTARTAVVPSPGVVHCPVPRSGDPAFTVGTLSRLAPWKGQDLVLRAFASAFPTGPARLRILGAAWFGEDAWAGQLRALACRLGVADRIVLTGHADPVMELAGIDVVVAFSRTPEPFGQAVVDAMSAGRAVVAAAEGGPASTVRHEVNGLLVPPRDVAALSGALRRLHDDVPLRRRLAAAGRRTAADYAPARLAAQLRDAYPPALT